MFGKLPRFALGSLAGLVVATIASAAAASNTVPPSRAGEAIEPATLAQLTPPACAGMNLNRLQIGPGGSGGGALILGTPDGGTLSGGGGADCIVGGANNTVLQGQGGNDVLIGGAVFFVFLNGGGGNDVCYRGAAFFAIPTSCETYYP
jgi:Ca2+-binding RTX toxin-like protein